MKKILLALLALAVSSQTLAAYDPDEDPEYSRKGTSRNNRASKSFSFLGQPVGIGPSGVFSAGIHFGFFIAPNSLILLDYGNGSMNDRFLENSTVKASNYGVYFKHFTGNSFYIKAGIDHRLVDYRYESLNWFGGALQTASFQGHSTAFGFALGNQWQFDSFTLGCDWIGFSWPFTHALTAETISANASASTIKDLRDQERNRLQDFVGQGVRFYLGFSF